MLSPLADGGVRLRAPHPTSPPAPAPAATNCTPAVPHVPAPGALPGKAAPGPNHFQFSIAGPDPDLAVGGTLNQQEHQRDETVRLAGYAAGSYESRVLPGSARWPSDSQVVHILEGLQPNPPIGVDGDQVTHAVYQSQVPNASGKDVFQHWVNHPNEVFNAGGMEIRPPTTTLKDGRYMLETAGTQAPPTWLPVEIKVDEVQQQIHIQTLDGHVLRGEQTFSFRDDGCGGATITQDARFQAGSKLVGDMQKFLPISTGQHSAWQQAHRESYEQFNGDRDYKGMGIPYVDPLRELAALGVTAASEALRHPGRAADAGIDLTGDVANLGFDMVGRINAWAADQAGAAAHGLFDTLHLPGGEIAQRTLHDTGRVLDAAADKTGDVLEAGADKLGDGAKKMVDVLFG